MDKKKYNTIFNVIYASLKPCELSISEWYWCSLKFTSRDNPELILNRSPFDSLEKGSLGNFYLSIFLKDGSTKKHSYKVYAIFILFSFFQLTFIENIFEYCGILVFHLFSFLIARKTKKLAHKSCSATEVLIHPHIVIPGSDVLITITPANVFLSYVKFKKWKEFNFTQEI